MGLNDSYLVDIAVIDSNHLTLNMYHIRSNWNNEYVERYLRLKGHRLGEVSWGLFRIENDERCYEL